MKWSGSSWACAQDDNTTYSQGTGISISGGTITNTGDTNAANDLTTSTSFGGDLSGTYGSLQIGSGAVGSTEISNGSIALADIGQNGCGTTNSLMKWGGSSWDCAPDNDSDTYTAPTQVPGNNSKNPLVTAGAYGYYSSITVGSDGLPVIAHQRQTSDGLFVAKCNDMACDSATNYQVDSGTGMGQYCSIAIGSDGFPVIAYQNGSARNLKVAKCNNHDCSSTSTPTTITSGSDNVGNYTSITVGVDGFPIISHYNLTISKLLVTHCTNSTCSGSATTTLSVDSSDFGRHSSIAIGTDGYPVISSYDSYADSLLIVKCSNLSCSSYTYTKPTSGGQFSSITIGKDGFPVISHLNTQQGDQLLVTKCSSHDCRTGTNTAYVDGNGSPGYYTSITIGHDGLPIISYQEIGTASSYDLRVAKCLTDNCSKSTIQTLDDVGSTGYYTSITIRPDGLPIISYYYSNSADLKVVRCANPYCLPYWSRR